MYDSDELRALAVAAQGHDISAMLDLRQEMTPNTVLDLLDEIERLRDALKGLSDMYTYAWDRIEGGMVMFDLERFEAAHKTARIALGTPFLDLDTGEPEA